MARQRMRVSGTDARLVVAIAVAGAVGALVAGPSPTGSAFIDTLLVGTASFAVVWAAASAPWWASVVACAIAAACAPTAALVALGVVGALAGAVVGVLRRAVPWTRALIAATALQVFARLGDIDRLGMSAALAIGVLGVLALLGVRRRPRRERRLVLVVIGGVLVAGFAALAGMGVAAAAARPDLERGTDLAQDGVDQLVAGDFDAARLSFEGAAQMFARADTDLGRPWAQPARFVPVVAQHRDAAADLVAAAESVSSTAAGALAQIEMDSLKVVDGRIDIAAIEALEAPLQQLQDSLTELGVTVDGLDSPWLADRLTTRLDDLVADIDRQQEKGENALMAVRAAPAMLGADGPRVYFVAFTTPVEARGLGGFMGNWAEVTVTDGDIDVTRFGRHTDLNEAGNQSTKRLTGMDEEFIEQYGEFGFSLGPEGGMRGNIWSDVTMSPHFPTVAQIVSQLYPQSGGRELDGVFAIDVYTMAALMQLTGPVELPQLDFTVTADNAAQFLLADQYALAEDTPGRVDALETVALTTIDRLLSGDLPSPPDLARLLGPYARQRRLVAWSARADEQALLEVVRMDGSLPPLGDGDGIAVVLNNAGNNKVDYYLHGDVNYEITTDEGRASSVLRVSLRNDAPSSGVPDYVIGNSANAPLGTNIVYVSVYSSVPFADATLDGRQVGFETGVEQGYQVASTYVEMRSGGDAELVVSFDGVPFDSDDPVVVRVPPTVNVLTTTISVDGVALTEPPIDESGVFRP